MIPEKNEKYNTPKKQEPAIEEETNAKDSEERAPPRFDRLTAIDFGRGFGLFIVVVTHIANYWAFPQLPSEPLGASDGGSMLLLILLFPFQLLGSWASSFALLTGASAAYIMYYQIVEKGRSPRKRILQSILSAVILLAIHFLYTYLVVYPTYNITELSQQGLIPGSLKGEGIQAPDWEFLFIAGPLSMIAFSNLAVSLVCGFFFSWKKDHEANVNIYLGVLSILGLIFVLGADPIQDLLIPHLYAQFEAGNYVIAMILTWLVGTKHCIFPFVGYGFFGGMFGLLWIRREPMREKIRKVKRVGYSFATFFLAIAVGDAILHGIPDLVGLYHPFFLYTLNLSLQLYIATFCLLFFDVIPEEERCEYARYRRIIIFRRLSVLSLSVFFIEQTTAALFTGLFLWIAPALLESFIFILVIFVPLYTYLFLMMVNRWEKFNFKYGMEWFLVCLVKGKKVTSDEDLLGVQRFIYKSSGYCSADEYFAAKQERKAQKNS